VHIKHICLPEKYKVGHYILIESDNCNLAFLKITIIDIMKYYIYVIFIFFLSCENEEHLGSLPFPPTNLSAQIIAGIQVELVWKDNATTETGYAIERKEKGGKYSRIGEVNANITHFTDISLPKDNTYIYRVYAYNDAGNSITYSNEVSITFYSLKGKLRMIKMVNSVDSISYEYKYDSLGRVKEILHPRLENNFLPTESFSRNSTGQIITYKNQSYYYINSKEFNYYTELYNYTIGVDGKYKSAQQTNYSGSSIFYFNETYTYTGNNITKMHHGDKYGSLDNFYSYDTKGNVIKIESSIFDSDSEHRYKVESTYDNKVYPVESLYAPSALKMSDYDLENRLFFWSINNLMTSKYFYDDNNDGAYDLVAIFSISYTYNKEGKPSSAKVLLSDSKGNKILDYSISYLYY